MERYSDTSVVAPERNSKAFKRCCSRLSRSTCIRVNGRSRPHWDQRFSSLCSFQGHVVCACRILNLNKQKHQTTLVFTMFCGVNATIVQKPGPPQKSMMLIFACPNMRKTYRIYALSSIQSLPVCTAEKQKNCSWRHCDRRNIFKTLSATLFFCLFPATHDQPQGKNKIFGNL